MSIPKLRFKADDGSEFPEWEEKSLGDIMSSMEYGMNVAAMKFDGTNKYLRITDIDDETHRYSMTDVVSPSGKLDEKYLVKTGDLFFARTGASVGKTYLYDKRDGIMYFAGFLIRGRIKPEYDPYYVYVQTLTPQYEEWVKIMSIRSGQPGINANEYASYKFLCATDKSEQQKIGVLFYAVDSVIEHIQSEIDAWEKQKRGVMQLLFSRKVRFKADNGSEFPGWEEKRLSDIAEYVSEGIDARETSAENYVSTENILKDFNGIEFSTEAPEAGILRKFKVGDILMSNIRPYLKKIWLSDKEGACNADVLIIRPKDSIDPAFLYALLATDEFIQYVMTGAKGSKMPRGDKAVTMNYKVPDVNIAEQKKIAACLSGFDDVIDKAKKELEAYRELKKGLLQQMFV